MHSYQIHTDQVWENDQTNQQNCDNHPHDDELRQYYQLPLCSDSDHNENNSLYMEGHDDNFLPLDHFYVDGHNFLLPNSVYAYVGVHEDDNFLLRVSNVNGHDETFHVPSGSDHQEYRSAPVENFDCHHDAYYDEDHDYGMGDVEADYLNAEDFALHQFA
eukprot:CAMPEP_0197305134 /NCGR_PEP_ID=MMETSP0891-20130614/1024_1 /TAXON_ID=44058 ORGANISM="Aureoumbra lagunensis, Strain CCMP1510" /NCGR_SAMPLE_ID=MMETSP0891 /ASSEMBLY_ACC=CAM_ASM_000534 /LENGTH=159 /DNA_ID=CAMNT_0042785843 /DNA_START=188 /DNA_END=667 /DNA_ORIENTATION=-